MRFLILLVLLNALIAHAERQETGVTSSIIADSKQCEPKRTDSFGACKVRTVKRSSLASEDLALVPTSGFVLWSGGFMSSVGVYAFDVQTQQLSFYRSKTLEHTLTLDDLKQVAAVSHDESDALVALSNQIWASRDSFMNNSPNADQNVRLMLADNGEIKDISSYGPPHGALDELFSRVLAIANGSGSER
jgi:hypothetical protein